MPAFFYTYSVGERWLVISAAKHRLLSVAEAPKYRSEREKKGSYPSAIAQGADRVASREIKQTATIFTECFF